MLLNKMTIRFVHIRTYPYRIISSVRIVVERVISGIKISRIVKDIFRNTKQNLDGLVMEIACGLHNFRNEIRSA